MGDSMPIRRPILTLILMALSLCIAATGSARILTVPGDHGTIQDAIDASIVLDTILVDHGVYQENILFPNYPLVLTSQYLLDRDPAHIAATIIDGSAPSHADTGTVVRITHPVDSFTVIQGFTITGGTGTKWVDEHGFGTYYEGGGILCAGSSPIIQHNWIVDNEAIQLGPFITSAGGGGIRAGDGNPIIRNNIISNNRGRYGAGMVLNFAEGIVRNNLIAYNTGGEDFAGSGIWKYEGGNAIVENNTIIGNESVLSGGGILVWEATMTVRNNIIRGNVAPDGAQIHKRINGVPTVSYCNVEGGYTGTGNFDSDPLYTGPNYHLGDGSPCIDAGDPATAYNDPEDPQSPGSALWPALGGLRNDVGAFGGSRSRDLDGDVDGDSVFNTADNCPFLPNAGQDDADSDGVGDPCDNCPDLSNPDQTDADTDGAGAGCDCNDADPDIYPGASEFCNGVDDDCDDVIDNNPVDGFTYYADADDDGYGDAQVTTLACSTPAGFVANSNDCNDGDPDVNPDVTEICDGIDNDCDQTVDGLCPWQADFDEDGFPTAVDLNTLINIIFFNASDVQDPGCPSARSDFNYDGVADAVDLNALIQHLFFNAEGPCDPCTPVQSSCSS
ncbi:MAG: hypothetical protein GF341_10640 [candidate division Zixibacteria bacterium]|nr:hypothetical protein [candidate division Zixibacteria bacterium]